jgi:simple sugar transport system substrate-binding protein
MTSAAVAALAGCGPIGQSDSPEGSGGSGWASDVNIRFFAGGDPGDLFASIVLKGAQQAEADLGAKVDIVFSKWDVERMTNQLREAIAASPDGIAMMGHPGDEALMPLAERANEQDIRMMYQNVDVPEVREELGGGYVGVDLTAQGKALGEMALRTLDLKSGDRAIVFGAWGDPGRYLREQGTADALEAAGLEVEKILAEPETASDPNLLTPKLSSAYQRNRDTRLIVLPGGQTMSSAPQYVDAIGVQPGEVYFIGFDLTTGILQAIKDGYVQITADQQPFLQGYLPVLSLCLMEKWNFSPLTYDTSSSFVTQDNYEVFTSLVEEGVR